jgi:D-glycero-beta-D-manno-heptose 1-phosphate adenylyltransferase
MTITAQREDFCRLEVPDEQCSRTVDVGWAEEAPYLRWYGDPPPRQQNPPVVVTGVFDILHPGHVRFLTWAAAQGRPLYVGVEDDARVRHWKGPNRPLHTLAERAEVLSSLRPVSNVFCILGDPRICEGADYVRLIRSMNPGALAFSAEDPHADAKRAGAVALAADCWEFPFEVGHSTSSLINRLGHNESQQCYSD